MQVRIITVKPGDAFHDFSRGAFVVETEDGLKAYGRYTRTGRAAAILISTLQRERTRLGTMATKVAHRMLEQIDSAKAAKKGRR